MKYTYAFIFLIYAFYRTWEYYYYSIFNEKEMLKRGARKYDLQIPDPPETIKVKYN